MILHSYRAPHTQFERSRVTIRRKPAVLARTPKSGLQGHWVNP